MSDESSGRRQDGVLRWRRFLDPDPPRRPSRADLRLAGPATAAWAVTALVTCSPAPAGRALVVLFVVAVVAVGTVSLRGHRPSTRAQAGALVPMVVVAALAGALALHRGEVRSAHPLVAEIGRRTGVMATTTGFPKPIGGGGTLVPVTVSSTGSGAAARPGRLDTVLLARGPGWASIPPGAEVRASVEVLGPRSPGDPPALRALGGPRIDGSGSVTGRLAQAFRHDFADVSRRALGPGSGALLPSVVLGDEGAVPDRVREEFRSSGLAHLSAVSGSNVTYVVGGVLLVSAASGLGRRLRPLVAVAVLAGFVLVVGPEPAVLRAAGTGAIGILALVTRRGGRPVAALSAVVLVVSVLDPGTAVGVGFVLSVAATVGLVAGARPFSTLLGRCRLPRPVADVVAVAVVAHVCTLPVLLTIGLPTSPWSVPANIAVAPAVPVVTVVGTTAAALSPAWPEGAELLARACGPPLWWLRTVAHTTAGLPGSPMPAR